MKKTTTTEPQANNNQNTIPKEDNQTDGKKQFVYKAYVEDVTGSWCSNCPPVIKIINQVKTANELGKRVVVVAVHNNNLRYFDPMHIDKSNSIVKYYRYLEKDNMTGFPYFAMNRHQQLYKSNAGQNIYTHLEKTPSSPLGIKISSELTETEGNVSVSFQSQVRLENLKYHIFIVEDNVIDYQFGVGSNFEHNDVLRDCSGNIKGNSLGTLEANAEVIKNKQPVSYKLLSTGKLNNVRVVVFVTDASNKVINVQEAKANTTQDYQYVK
ncbi:Omp28-related outer membrane protein [Capnocytophaga catalasegens]|uniref:Outer membrane protein Omp28 n=1 Tax=Capnocytophaga catalasegens TaxID=1004260 RepID=A0AAV5ARW7_9FLAO|nr:Omp28-related outer membrane protein [Capnocytophaga catalasegens]GIZ14930.1 hypothetical protein RCZ03_09300 [Capnocytophaga catalasegens]GJM49309.1 hypothetical protein RCZ15_02840 [Capnocytophaga catalasegens]GJM52460.1 hypothetical protein RCZ16_07770 [Capnocytophaga catalasegens]